MLLGAGILSIAALVLVKVELALEWRWSLFWWGLALGLGSIAGINAAINALLRADARRPSPPRDLIPGTVGRRRLIYSAAWLFMSVEVGMAAAMFDQPLLVIALSGYLVVAAATVLLLVVLKNRQQS